MLRTIKCLGGSAMVLLLLATISDAALAQTGVPGVIRRSRDIGVQHQDAQDRLADEIETVESEADTSTASSGGSSLPPIPIPRDSSGRRTIEFSAPSPRVSAPVQTASASTESNAISQEALDRWHVRHNVCPGEWTVEDFNSLFPTIDRATVNAACP